MKVREESLIMQNVICVEEILPHKEWYKPVIGLRTNLVSEGIYHTSPVVFQVEELENEPNFGRYTYYISINTLVEEEDFFTQVEHLTSDWQAILKAYRLQELERLSHIY